MANFYGKVPGIFGSGGGGTPPLADKVALSASASSTAVVFGIAFGAAPVVLAFLTSTSGTADMVAVQGVTATTTGFTAEYSTQIPDNTYTLNWMASAVND